MNALTFEPESNNIISCGVDKVLIVLDFRTSTQIYSKILEVEALSLTWLNSLLLIGDDWGDVSIWDPKFNWISKFNCHNGNSKKTKFIYISYVANLQFLHTHTQTHLLNIYKAKFSTYI